MTDEVKNTVMAGDVGETHVTYVVGTVSGVEKTPKKKKDEVVVEETTEKE